MESSSIYFKEIDNFSTSNQYIVLNIDAVADRLTGVDLSLLKFKTNEYPTMCRDASVLNAVLVPINMFFKWLSLEDQATVAQTLIMLHYMVLETEETRQSFEKTLTQCGNILQALDAEINLNAKLLEYTTMFIPVDDMEECGTLAQHTAEMTFSRDEIISLTSLALLSKLMSPIVGPLLTLGKKCSAIGFREVDCASIYTPFLNKNWNKLMLRLNFYSKNLVDKRLNDDSISAYHGLTPESVYMRNKSNIFIKKFVTEDIYNGNVSRYITSCVRSGATSQYENAKTKCNVQFRKDPSEGAQEDGNTSKMESESKPSKHSADFPVILKYQTRDIWLQYVEKYNLDKQTILAAKAFYDTNLLVPTPLSIYLLTNYFGAAFGGGKSIVHIKLETHTYMVATLQHILASMSSPALTHALSMVPSDRIKTRTPEEQKLLLTTWSATGEFKICKQEFPTGFGESSWDNKLKDIVEDLVANNYLFNTAPVYWDMIGTRNLNGSTVKDYNEMVKDTCSLLYLVYTEDSL